MPKNFAELCCNIPKKLRSTYKVYITLSNFNKHFLKLPSGRNLQARQSLARFSTVRENLAEFGEVWQNQAKLGRTRRSLTELGKTGESQQRKYFHQGAFKMKICVITHLDNRKIIDSQRQRLLQLFLCLLFIFNRYVCHVSSNKKSRSLVQRLNIKSARRNSLKNESRPGTRKKRR